MKKTVVGPLIINQPLEKGYQLKTGGVLRYRDWLVELGLRHMNYFCINFEIYIQHRTAITSKLMCHHTLHIIKILGIFRQTDSQDPRCLVCYHSSIINKLAPFLLNECLASRIAERLLHLQSGLIIHGAERQKPETTQKCHKHISL